MPNDDIIHNVRRLADTLDTKIQITNKGRTLNEIDNRIGTLSNPSKMPGHAWSISAHRCITGAKLRQLPNTPCSKCYAHKGRYSFTNVQTAMEKRYKSWEEDSDWAILMAIRIILLGDKAFRWFDSGDLQSVKMLEDINKVAELTTKYSEHWLPTQERSIVKNFLSKNNVSPNLCIRISSSIIGDYQKTKLTGVANSYVTRDETIGDKVHLCEAKKQGNKCLTCRCCWSQQIDVAYPLH